MKIISKHKDYYDFKVAKYGRDPNLTYDRRALPLIAGKQMREGMHRLCVCGENILFWKKNGKFIFDKKDSRLDSWDVLNFERGSQLPTVENIKFRQPVLIINPFYKASVGIPKLSDLNFSKIIGPDEMYQKIVAYLGWLKDNPEPPQITDDKLKAKAAGFDTKTSFRPKMK